MIYEFRVDNAANTSYANRNKTEMQLSTGIIYKVEVLFPIGCAQLAHARILQGGVQIWPSITDQDFTGDGFQMSFFESHELHRGETLLILETWNEDDTYSHKITVRIGLMQKDVLFPELKLADLIRMFFKSFMRRS